MIETLRGNLPEEWLAIWESLPEGVFLPFAIVLFYWLGRHWTIKAAGDISNRYAYRLDELEEKGWDIKEFALRQNLRNVAALSGHAKLTNGLLGAILAVLIFR